MVAGYAHKVVGLVTATEKGVPIQGSATMSPTVGAMNILVMGLESRTNYQGQPCEQPADAMHAGNAAASPPGSSAARTPTRSS